LPCEQSGCIRLRLARFGIDNAVRIVMEGSSFTLRFTLAIAPKNRSKIESRQLNGRLCCRFDE